MSKKKIVSKIRLRLIKSDGSKESITTKKIMKVWSKIKHDSAVEWNLEVEYRSGYTNSGSFTRKVDVEQALSSWTEQELIDYINDE
jgi:hypothetical protein